MQNKNNRQFLRQALPLAACIGFFLVFVLIDGPVICVDSESYITADNSRPPLYPMFLFIMRQIFGETPLLYGSPLYLFPAALIAGAVNGYATWRVGQAVWSEMKRAGIRHPQLFGILASGMQLAVALLNRFSAKRSSMYAESILSESLAMPLYLLFCIDLWYWMTRHEKKHLLRLFLLMTALLASRTHMVIVPALFFVISLIHDLIGRHSRSVKRFLLSVALCGAAYILALLFDCSFHLAMHGEFMKHTFGNKAFYSTMMYNATPEVADAIDPVKNADERKLFLTLLENCRERSLLEDQMPPADSWIDMAEHFAFSYDSIGFNATIETVEAYIDERIALYNGEEAADYTGAGIDFEKMLTPDETGRLTLTEARRALVYDDIITVFNLALVKRIPPFSLRAYGTQILSGLMNGVAKMSDILQPYVLAIYALYLFLLLKTLRKGSRELFLAGEIVLIGIIINACAVGLLMFTQSRYMIYNMGAFYTFLPIMAYFSAGSARRSQVPDTASPQQ